MYQNSLKNRLGHKSYKKFLLFQVFKSENSAENSAEKMLIILTS